VSEAGEHRRDLASSLFVPLTFFVVLWLCVPIGTRIQYNTDEGINLIKALLHARGARLYTDLWSDQPPLFTWILSLGYEWLGPSAHSARLFVLGLASLLLWCFHATLRQSLGPFAALLATLGLLFSRHFIRLSVSVMIGLPALSLALVSIWALGRFAQDRRPLALVVSGVAFALSLQIKLFGAFLGPLLLLRLLLLDGWDERRGAARERIRAAAGWLAVFALATLPTAASLDAAAWGQLVGSHLGDSVRAAFAGGRQSVPFLQLFAYHQPAAVLAAVGAVHIVRRRLVDGLLPLAWFVAASLLLAWHTPIWFHHILLISIPLFWLAGFGLQACVAQLDGFPLRRGFDSLDRAGRATAVLLGLCVGASVSTSTLAFQVSSAPLFAPERACRIELRGLVARYRDDTRWVFADEPIYAYEADLPVPPETAVMTEKRLRSGNLPEGAVLRTLQTYRPEQVLIGRFGYSPETHAYLAAHYTPVLRCGPRTLYLAHSLAGP